MPRAALLLALGLLGAGIAEASDARRFAALAALKDGMPFATVQHRLLRAGWHSYRGNGMRTLSRCESQRRICRVYPAVQGCWEDSGRAFCIFEYLDTRRRPAALGDEILRLRVRIDPLAGPVHHDHHTTSFGGRG